MADPLSALCSTKTYDLTALSVDTLSTARARLRIELRWDSNEVVSRLFCAASRRPDLVPLYAQLTMELLAEDDPKVVGKFRSQLHGHCLQEVTSCLAEKGALLLLGHLCNSGSVSAKFVETKLFPALLEACEESGSAGQVEVALELADLVQKRFLADANRGPRFKEIQAQLRAMLANKQFEVVAPICTADSSTFEQTVPPNASPHKTDEHWQRVEPLPAPLPTLKILRQVGNPLGLGGSGARVFRGRWTRDGHGEERDVVVKRYDVEHRETYLRELAVLERVQHERYVVGLWDHIDCECEHYLVLEPLLTFSESMETRPATEVPIEERWRMAKQLVAATHWLHKQNTVHGDLHPTNVCIRRSDGHIKLIDFERSKSFDHSDRFTLFPGGKHRGWYPPEAVVRASSAYAHAQGRAGKREDMWMLGRLLACVTCWETDAKLLVEEHGKSAVECVDRYLEQAHHDLLAVMLSHDAPTLEGLEIHCRLCEYGKRFVLADAVWSLLREQPEERPTARELRRYLPFDCSFERLLGCIQLASLAPKLGLALAEPQEQRYDAFASHAAPPFATGEGIVRRFWTYAVESAHPKVWTHMWGDRKHKTNNKLYSQFDSAENALPQATRFLRNLTAHCVEYESEKKMGPVSDVTSCIEMLLPLCSAAYSRARMVARHVDRDGEQEEHSESTSPAVAALLHGDSLPSAAVAGRTN
mmetsp:Transcript_4554/g.13914  ORF Transcript_4554/g.13914 Transcript_4554/m.13914 type:complete len:702 (+) Transcript_4554:93-2198(+)|eukprot:CAMPEP_0174242078 /NCGR_PEP_ID=MMETSP0417-20130205/26286_1 /TAXON_ID=242541 /ORGANISM="Mayorella sp, Strain BSH-02190019" /LENGTH=701 /DNA_ID=CAMNT_0015321433 /DNA_START=1 /DNA_END=2106 /DNA_ORIENTATION=+